MMADQFKVYNVNNTLHSDIICSIKEMDDFSDNKVHVTETAISIDDGNSQDHIRHDKTKHYAMSTVFNNIETELLSPDVKYDLIEVKTEEGIGVVDIKIKFDNEILYCEDCHEYYEAYCHECGMLEGILNKYALNSADSSAREDLPDDILEIQNSCGLGIFALKVIPEGVKFGPFIGLSTTGCFWKIRGGKFVIQEDNSKYLNWMQYVNPAKNTSEQNLFVFQYENNLYYRSTRKIQVGDELLVYFGEECEEVDFIPITEHIVKDVFACTFCCLGFSSKANLAKHKTVCYAADGFSIEELARCPYCKIHVDQKEYVKHHMTYCCERNKKKYIPPTPKNPTAEVNEQCMYTAKYNVDIEKHSRVRTFKCGICYRRFKAKETLRLHVEKNHIFAREKEDQEDSRGVYANSRLKVDHSLCSQDEIELFKCSLCQVRMKSNHGLKLHIKTKHLKEFDHKCDSCEFRTNHKGNLKRHINRRHLKEFNYECEVKLFKCSLCQVRMTSNDSLKRHIKTKHLKEFDHKIHKCDTCDFRTSQKRNLKRHINTIHLKEFDYKCDTCEFRTNGKHHLEKHIKAIHLKEFTHECDKCDYKTNYKRDFEIHTKTQHLKEFNYWCDNCEFRTNQKRKLKLHIKTKHLKEFDYNCGICGYQTNRRDQLKGHVKQKHCKD